MKPTPSLPDGAVKSAFVFRVAAELIAEPAPPEWLVRQWFELGSLVLFFGDAASCKTWLALALAMSIASGRAFFGADVHPGAVFILAGEGHRGLRRRLAGMSRHYGIDLRDVPLFVSDTAAAVTDLGSVAAVIRSVDDLAASTGHRPVLIVVDTVSRNFGAADENSTGDMAAFVRGADWMRDKFGATVLLIHHVGHGDKTRARGNTTLRGALDAEYRIAKDAAGVIAVECSKAKDFESPPDRHFCLVDVDLDWRDEEGGHVRSAAIVPTEPPPPADVAAGGMGRRQIEALRLLREEYARRRETLQRGGFDPSGALVEADYWREMLKGKGFTRQALWKVTTALQARGAVRMQGPHVVLPDEADTDE